MKTFTTTGICVPDRNYMVDISDKLRQIRSMIDAGQYFTINRARQYGKTTTLTALSHMLRSDYHVLILDFQYITDANFRTEEKFVKAFCRLLAPEASRTEMPDNILEAIRELIARKRNLATLPDLFDVLMDWCCQADRPIVMLIDEVDTATNNQIFLDFLALLRLQYLQRQKIPGYRTFQSVILAGVTDVKNLKRKIRPEDDHKQNSPWNIAAPFLVDMSLSASGIAGMLAEYEHDHHTGMNPGVVAREIHHFTSGYPFLVSRICEILDQKSSTLGSSVTFDFWTVAGVAEAVRQLLQEKNTLFDSLMGKVIEQEDMSRMLERILFSGDIVAYNPDTLSIADAEMYGLVRNDYGSLMVANIIFETRLYNYFLSTNQLQESPLFRIGANEKYRFVQNGHLNLRHVLEKYISVYEDLYGKNAERISETEGRRRFLLFIRPIINGTGNYYIEPETRNHERMDLVIDYLGQRFVIELKIWRGPSYHAKGEEQLAGYLDSYHLDRGYLLTYSFTKAKQRGVKSVRVHGKELIEAVV